MSFEDKRKIVQTACGGKDAKGNRYGVYVKKPDKIGEPLTYEIRGVLADIQGQLPMSLKDIQNILGLEEEYVGHYNPLKGKSKVKQDMFSKLPVSTTLVPNYPLLIIKLQLFYNFWGMTLPTLM